METSSEKTIQQPIVGKIATYLATGLIRFYRFFISPLTGSNCRFSPSCSEYSLQAYRQFGFIKASYLVIKRLLKCHPFHPGGVDHVPTNHDTATCLLNQKRR